jgi:hypothetical protein
MQTHGTGIFILALAASACGGESEGDDPVTSPTEPTTEAAIGAMPQAIRLGFVEGSTFRALGPNDPCPIIEGPQGGTWTMPIIRVQGLSGLLSADGTLASVEEQLGTARATVRFDVTSDGWLEFNALAIPVMHEAPREYESVDDVFGLPGSLFVRVSDGVDAIEAEVQVVLSDGS